MRKCELVLALPGDAGNIGCNYAPDVNGTNPQGVPLDSWRVSYPWETGKWEKHRRCVHFCTQRRQLCYMYCSTIIYIIYFISDTRGLVVRGTGNAKYEN